MARWLKFWKKPEVQPPQALPVEEDSEDIEWGPLPTSSASESSSIFDDTLPSVDHETPLPTEGPKSGAEMFAGTVKTFLENIEYTTCMPFITTDYVLDLLKSSPKVFVGEFDDTFETMTIRNKRLEGINVLLSLAGQPQIEATYNSNLIPQEFHKATQ